MPSAQKRKPGRTQTCSWRGIITTIIIITGGITTTTTIIITGGITTTTITTITDSISVDDGEFANLGLMRSHQQWLD